MAAVEHRHSPSIIFGHDVRKFLRYAIGRNKAKMSGEDKRA